MAAPDASLVLLTKNAGGCFEQTLAAIFAQEFPGAFEVLAIDSGSTDGTLERLRAYPIQVKTIPSAEFNFGATRALGYDMARGEFLVTLSQDAVPANAHWLELLLAPFQDSSVAAVSGSQLLPPGRRVFYWERIGRFYFTRAHRRWKARYGFGFSNVNSALRRAVWVQHPLGAIEMSEDKLLQKTWSALGLKILSVPAAAVYHAHDFDVPGLARRCENEGLAQRLRGENYSLMDCLLDICNVENWRLMLSATARREITTAAEIGFPLLRPLFQWKGNHWTQRYVHAPSAA
jgi:rhamnosyltransferase